MSCELKLLNLPNEESDEASERTRLIGLSSNMGKFDENISLDGFLDGFNGL